MDVFKEYDHIFLTTVLLISRFSTFAVAVCTLPTELHNSVWNYQYTDLSNNSQTTTLTFGRTTLTKPSNIRLNALGTTLNAWTCISNLTLSSAVSVAVFKSDASYSDANGIRKWVYICMKLTKVADDFFYFYLLSDEDSSVYPKERVYQSSSIPDNTVPVCSTFCQYTSQPRIRTLKKSGSSTTLPGDVSLCEPCDSSCEGATTETTSLKTTQNTTLPFISSEIDITLNITKKEATQETTAQSISTEMIMSTEMAPLEITQKTTTQSVDYKASCAFPEDLKNTLWEYNYTDVANNEEQTTNLYIANTTLPDSVINLNAEGTIVNNWTCINSLDISDTTNVVVFKGDTSFPSGGSRRLYLCMKLTQVTTDLFYFHLLSDIKTSIFPNERVFISEADNPPADDASICSTFCQYTQPLKIRTLRRQGSSATLASNVTLCEPCDSACEEATTRMTSLETTQITTLPSTTSASSNTETTELRITTTDLKDETTLETKLTDANCALPEDLKNTVWEYNYTDVASNSEQSTNLYIANSTLPDSVINLNAEGTILNNWTCIKSLNLSDTTNVVVFKSDKSFPNGGSKRLHLCLKFTQVTTDLFYFHLLSDIKTSIFPNERVFISEADNVPEDNASICSTFCQYTESLRIRTLRRQDSSATLPSNISLCEPCDSACDEVTTIMTSLDTAQITTLPSTSTDIDTITNMTLTDTTDQPTITSTLTEIGTTPNVKSTEKIQKATVQSTLTEMYATTDLISTETTQKATVPSTLTKIETTKDMISTQTTQTAKKPSTSSKIDTTAKLVSTTTTSKMTIPSASTEMDTTIKLTSTDTIQTTIVHSTSFDLKTTKLSTISSTDTDTETTTELKVTTTDLEDVTTLQTKSKDTEIIKQYSGPIALAVVVCPGFVLVITVFVLLKHVKRPSMINTNRIINTKAEETFGSTSEESYVFYKGEEFGFQKIAIKHWDNN